MEPDFQSFANAWLDGDPRSQGMADISPEVRQRIATRIAEALERRRREVAARQEDAECLVVTVPEESLSETGLEASVLSQLEEIVQDHLKKISEE